MSRSTGGAGNAMVVLLPGMDGSGLLFADFIEALGADVDSKVVAYPPDRALGYPELTELARAELPSNRPFVLLAESFSGPVAVALAALRPPGLRALVLVCSFVRSPISVPAVLWRMLAALPVERAPLRLAAAVLLGKSATPLLRGLLARAVVAVKRNVWRSRLAAVMSIDVENVLSEIRVPLLYLRARQDRVVPRSASEVILRALPRTRFVELDSPHFMLQAKPAESAAQIHRLLREVV
jgi:pimeloyl-[acyl-carrier protein] methyl ester esterase